MDAIFIKNGVVVNIAAFEDGAELPKDWKKAENGEQIGWLDNGDGTFSAPIPEVIEPTIDEQIAALEASVTPRNLRGAALGDQYAIDHIQSVEDQIQALRAQL
jgi:hypothetical protein